MLLFLPQWGCGCGGRSGWILGGNGRPNEGVEGGEEGRGVAIAGELRIGDLVRVTSQINLADDRCDNIV